MALVPDLISIIALVVSVFTFTISFLWNRKLSMQNLRYREAIFYMERNFATEGRLIEMPDALKLFGIDMENAEKEGISKDQICYLIISLNAMRAICKARSISEYEHLKASNYRQVLFECQATRDAWGYVRNCFPGVMSESIDKYLSENMVVSTKKHARDNTSDAKSRAAD